MVPVECEWATYVEDGPTQRPTSHSQVPAGRCMSRRCSVEPFEYGGRRARVLYSEGKGNNESVIHVKSRRRGRRVGASESGAA